MADSAIAPNGDATPYLLEEMKLLRHEIELRSEEQRSMERYVILADAAIYASLAFPDRTKSGIELVVAIGWYLPTIIAVAALVRWRESIRMIRLLASYTRKQEAALLGPGQGWETYLSKMRSEEVPVAPGLFVLFWAVLAAAPAGLAAFQHPLILSGWSAAGTQALVAAIPAILLIYWPTSPKPAASAGANRRGITTM